MAEAALTLRTAGPADAADAAAFHVRIWRETYAALAPADAVAALDEARRLPQWQEALSGADPRRGTLLAERDGAIVGLVSHGPPGSAVYGALGEVKHLYVCPSCRGSGLGRRLMAHAFRALAAAGYPGAGLAVVRGNAGARAFYRALGGREARAFTDPGPLWKSDNILVVWEPMPAG
ncbi:GNAT family N-acetyltransferase [Paroceanicella profunda]|uniref:GNAT family N-acetyltransferase n=1 Tax=Paroceanicella profunda TaxID=2579971 RepID=UPI001478A785|nr:GNAT family N-acetyltransferase [Paroceanicella profunda]